MPDSVIVASSVRLSILVTDEAALLFQLTEADIETKTRKLCYRKDNRAMRSIYGYPENFL